LPLPTLLLFAFATGVAAAVAAKAELRVNPRTALLTRGFAAYAVFVTFCLIPISIYFYVFHGDWFLLYLVDVRRVPSAVALIGFVLEGGMGAVGFAVGAALVRAQREAVAGTVAALSFVASGGVAFALKDRLALVGTYAQHEGGFGQIEYGAGPLLYGTMVMGALLLLGAGLLLGRLYLGARRG
jgi:hypothetical protein